MYVSSAWICIALPPHYVRRLLYVTYNIITEQLLASGHHSAWVSSSHCHPLQLTQRLANWQQMIPSPSFLSRDDVCFFFPSLNSQQQTSFQPTLKEVCFPWWTIYISEGKYVSDSEAWDRNGQDQWTYRLHAAYINFYAVKLRREPEFEGSLDAILLFFTLSKPNAQSF